MRKSFTMIELVFVIVILGILASVAIPKLIATRNDAHIAVLANQLKNASNEIVSYVFSQMKVENNLSKMSNILEELEAKGVVSIDTTDKKATVKIGNIDNCIEFKIVSGSNEENLTIKANDPDNDIECKGVQHLINFKNYPIVLRGQLVKY